MRQLKWIIGVMIFLGGIPLQAATYSLPTGWDHYPVREIGGRLVVEVKLRDALRLGLEQSTSLEAVRKGETIARYALTAIEERNHALLTNRMDYGRSITPIPGSETSFLNVSRSDASVLTSRYSQRLSTGIEYGAVFAESRSRIQSIGIAQEGDSPQSMSSSDWLDSSRLTGFVSIPIFQDWGQEFNDIPVRFGEIGVERSQWNIRQSELGLMSQIALSYWALVGLWEQAGVQQEAVRLSKQLLEDNRTRVEAGILSTADFQITQTQLAREEQLLASLDSEIYRVEDQIRAVLNLGEVEIGIYPIDKPGLQIDLPKFDEYLPKIYDQHPSLKLLQATLKQNQFELMQIRNQEKPNVDLSFEYTVNGFRSEPFGGIADFNQTELNGWNTALTWTIPLFDQVTPRNKLKKEEERTQIEMQIKDIQSNLKVQLQSIIRALHLASREVQTAQVTKTLAEKQLQGEMDRFHLGKSTSFRVAQFQQDAALARQQEILSRIRYEQIFVEFSVLTQAIYEQYELSR